MVSTKPAATKRGRTPAPKSPRTRAPAPADAAALQAAAAERGPAWAAAARAAAPAAPGAGAARSAPAPRAASAHATKGDRTPAKTSATAPAIAPGKAPGRRRPAPVAPATEGAAPYARIKRQLKEGLLRGLWPPGARLPSEAELVARYAVSRMTVGRALNELQAEGLVERVQGVGSFAARLEQVAATLRLQDVHEEIAARGHQHHCSVLALRAERANPWVAAQLELPRGQRVFHSLLLHHDNGQPLQLEARWVMPDRVPDYLQQDFTQTTPTRLLFERTVLRRADYQLEACAATAEEAAALQIEPASPCLVVVRRTHDRSGVITVARLVHPGPRFLLRGHFQP